MKLIDRERAMIIAERYGLKRGTVIGRHSEIADAICDEIAELPTVDAKLVRHGKWKHCPGMNSKCSECGRYFPVKEFESRPFDINYCPNCGAKMDRGDD